MNRILTLIFVSLLMLGSAQVCQAQEETPEAVPANDDKNTINDKSANSPTTSQAPPECKLCRWIDLKTASISFRYRTITDGQDTRTYNQLQHRELLDIAFKFDPAGRYTINAHGSSGYYFNWAYAGTYVGGTSQEALYKYADKNHIPRAFFDNLGLKAEGSNFWFRQLYFQARPVNGLEIQYGGLPILRGENSEITTYDDDGYIVGGRVSIKSPKKFFFDEMSVTYAYLGDIVTPNLFRRGERFKQSNYHQFLLAKKIGSRLSASGDYTWHDGVHTLHEAIRVNVKESKVLDLVRFETYQRLNDFHGLTSVPVVAPFSAKADWGYGLYAEKAITPRFTLGGGFNDIDFNHTTSPNVLPPNSFFFILNGDRMGVGKRLYLTTNIKLSDEFSLSAFAAKAVDVPPVNSPLDPVLWNKTHINFAINWDFRKTLKRTGIF